ncbi:MAG: hypothetical protein V4500_07660 [Pseudomonadota bacterium]
MQRVKRTTAVAVLPADPAGGTPGYFPLPNPGGGVPAAVPGYEWYNNVQEELCAVIAAAGIALDGANRAQVLAALRSAGVFTTPPQFDNTTKAATTGFVRSAGLQASKITVLTANTTLTAADAGSIIVANSATPLTITMPSAAALPSGAKIEFMNIGTAVATLSRAGTDQLAVNNTGATSLALGNGDNVIFASNGAGSWYPAAGSAQLKYADAFASSLGINGYQKLPNGLIIQWGTATFSAAGSAVLFPIAFPNSIYQVIPGNANGTGTVVSSGSVSLTGFTATATGTSTNYWFAIGK